MARIPCLECDKTFRGESGRQWHLEHIHRRPQPKGNLDKADLKKTLREAFKEEIDAAYQRGYEKGKQDWQIWYFCNVCGEKLQMRPNDNDHKALIGYMKEHSWGHKACHEKA